MAGSGVHKYPGGFLIMLMGLVLTGLKPDLKGLQWPP